MNRHRRLTFRQACDALGIFDESDSDIASVSSENNDHVEVDGTGDTVIDDSDLDVQEIREAEIEMGESEEESESEEEEETIPEEINDSFEDRLLQNPANIRFSMTPISPALRQRNILRQNPGTRSNPVDEISSWRLFHTNDIFHLIKRSTNRKISQHNRNNGISIKLFTDHEIHAALAIIYRAGVDRDNFSDLVRLFHPTDSRPFYHATSKRSNLQPWTLQIVQKVNALKMR